MHQVKVLLAGPRGFCAGVDRAILTVRTALAKHGKPVYVRHEIVHNRTVVEELMAEGAIFIEDFTEIPVDNLDRPMILSAHGSPKEVLRNAERLELMIIDAVCPLVTKVHIQVAQFHASGFEVIFIGHVGHQEVIGTLGQLPDGAIHLVGNIADAEALELPQGKPAAYVMQTTLSTFEVDPIIAVLERRFPGIKSPRKSDICYATTNRQNAVMEIIDRGADAIIVVGGKNSSNTQRLVEVAALRGCNKAFLVPTVDDMPWDDLGTPQVIGITAGASAPESIVQGILAGLRERFDVDVETVQVAEENFTFKLPRGL